MPRSKLRLIAPSYGMFKLYCDRHGIHPRDAYYIGDHLKLLGLSGDVYNLVGDDYSGFSYYGIGSLWLLLSAHRDPRINLIDIRMEEDYREARAYFEAK